MIRLFMNYSQKTPDRYPNLLFRLLFAGSLFFMPLRAQTQTVYAVPQLPPTLENIAQGARAAALGSAFTAVPGDASSLYLNPAGLGFLRAGRVSLLGETLNGGISRGTLAAAFPLSTSGSVALGVDGLDYDGVTGQGGLSPFSGSFTLGLGLSLGPAWALGVSTRYSYYFLSPGNDSISAYLSGGVLWKATSFWTWGVFYNSYDTQSPVGSGIVKIGSAWSGPFFGADPSLITLDLSTPTNGLNQIQMGLEQRFLSDFALRIGYDQDLETATVGGFQGLTGGLGLSFSPFELNYAFSPMGNLGSYHTLDLTWDLPGKIPSSPTATPTATLTPDSSPMPTPAPISTTPSPNSLSAKKVISTPTFTGTPVTPASLSPTADSTPLPVVFKPAPDGAVTGDLEVKKLRFVLPDTQPAASVTPSPDMEAGIQILASQVAQNPKDAASWVALGNLYWKSGQPDYAAQAFEEALAITPDDDVLIQWLNNYKAQNAAGNKTPAPQTIK
jgi:tetratricopeptide (TPR) repeat protein